MARKTENAADLIQALVPLITDLFPLVLDKWAQLQNRPRMQDLEEEISSLKENNRKKGNWLTVAVVGICVLILWNTILTLLLVLRS